MAQNVYLVMTANGTTIEGDSTVTSLDRDKTIECMSYEESVTTEMESSSGRATGTRTYGPLKIVKRIDKSSPLLARALCNNEVIEGEFNFYRPNPEGDGTTEKFFTVKIVDARVSAIERKVPDTFMPVTDDLPALETVSFAFPTIIWTYHDGGVEHEDKWSERE